MFIKYYLKIPINNTKKLIIIIGIDQRKAGNCIALKFLPKIFLDFFSFQIQKHIYKNKGFYTSAI